MNLNNLPQELIEKIGRYLLKTGNVKPGKAGFALPVSVVDWSDCIFGDHLIVPQNTAGSDDYHECQLVLTHNVKIIHECEIPNFIASAAVYEKENPKTPGYFVIESMEPRGGYTYQIFTWN